ncbi:MAG: choice-of-anchor D domain-containing protein [Actinomycetota bacterium]
MPGSMLPGGRKVALSGRARVALLLVLAVTASLLFGSQARSLGPGTTFLASLSSEEAQANQPSRQPAISAEGQWVAFATAASNLVPGDTNGVEDVFVRDILQGNTVRVSVATDGTEGNNISNAPAISGDGRFVAFVSNADNLLGVCGEFPCDVNSGSDVFVRDRDTDRNGVFDEAGGVATVIVSVDDDGAPGFGANTDPDISADGRFVAFVSNSEDLDPADTDDVHDVFVRDRDTDVDGIFDEPGLVSTELVSRASGAGGAKGNQQSLDPSISAGGRFVAFTTNATNLLPGGADSNGVSDIYVRDRDAVSTARVSVRTSGEQANGPSVQPTIDLSSRFVAFASDATNLLATPDGNGITRDVFIRDRDADGDGAFDESGASSSTTLASLSSGGAQGNARSTDPDMTMDGRYVAYQSLASNLRRGDTNRAQDVFVRDQFVGRTNRVSISAEGDETPPRSVNSEPVASDSGQFVAFVSNATNLVGQDSDDDGVCDSGCDANDSSDVFIRDRQPTVQIDPIPIQFPTRIVTTTSPEQLVSVANEGDGPVTIASVTVVGPGNPGDFIISTDGCTDTRLHPEEECFVGIQFRPTASGTRSALFAVTRRGSVAADSALLLGGGFQPIVALTPNIGPPGFVPLVDGALFPPNSTIVLKWKPGIGRFEIQSDADGNITGQVLVFHKDITGPRLLRATGPGVRAETDFMVTPATGQPPDFVSRG